jgi:hypothetical protein
MNRKQRRAGNGKSPLGGYGDRARDLFPGYVAHGKPCDACGGPVVGSRTLTWLDPDGSNVSILVRTCREHTDCKFDVLAAKLPGLPASAGVGYIHLGGGA